MEELWKKFKEDTKEDLEKINEFLNSLEKSKTRKKNIELKSSLSETSMKISHERREIYGKLRDMVKQIMEKEKISRAQAYRRAKLLMLNETSEV